MSRQDKEVEMFECCVPVLHETAKAILISEDPTTWLPLSQIDVIRRQGVNWTISLPMWLAKKVDLV